MKEFRDQLDRKILLHRTPKRIISLVPSITELIVDLGLESNLVGVTKFCVHPEFIKNDKVIVGGTKSVHLDKIRALKPDIVLCNKEENTKVIVESCENICAVHVSDIYAIEDCVDLIYKYGELFTCQVKALEIVESIEQELDAFKADIKNQPVLKIGYFIWKNPWMVAGKNTFIDDLLRLNKYQNVFGYETRYPEIALSDHRLQEVDVIFLSSEPFPFKEEDKNKV